MSPPSANRPHDRADATLDDERHALIERTRQLGATAVALESALQALAVQAEAVLHRLRGGHMH